MDRRFTDKMNDVLSVPKTAGRRHLVIGFATVLTLMVGVTGYTLLRLSTINDQLSAVVNVHNVKNELVADLRDAMRQRQLGLRDMLLVDDPFERDEAWQRHMLAASRFMTTRQKLAKMPMSDQERIAFDAMTKGATDGAVIQRKLLQQLDLDQQIPRRALLPAFHTALNAQDAAFTAMNNLSVIQKKAAREVAEGAQQAFRQTMAATLFLVMGAVLMGGLVAWSVLRRDQKMRSALQVYQNQLQNLVQERTAELLNANSELESYSYSLAHDLNAPLRAITSYSQILEEDAKEKLDPGELDSLQRITRAGQVMNRLIEDILKLSRITRSGFHREPVSLSELVKSQATRLSSLYTEREIRWQIAENILVSGDSLLLTLLLEHLLENAIRFSRDKPRTEIQFGVEQQDGAPVYFVKDNGCGFDMRYADRLFTAFQRLHGEDFTSGTGVGLAMVQRIVQRHGGRVWAESELGVGSVFFFTLPESH
ncbi:MAG TPA: hypothetical protein ENI97_08800 [Gammaproteobacteria bacterium]|nr:hypothetical protein [Gammaproteobacteria bacterium]